MDLDAESLRRARVRAQLLDAPATHVVAVVDRLVGIQAQELRAAALAIRSRTAGLTAAAVTAAVASGELLLTWTLRGTRHLHHRDDVPWLLDLLGPMYSRPTKRDADLGIAGTVGERAIAALRMAVNEDGPLTRAQVKERLAPLGVDPTGQAPIHVIRKAALAGFLSVVPGEKERYAPFACHRPAIDPDQAAAELARRYRTGYGPSTPADFAAWSGLNLRTAEAAWPVDHEADIARCPSKPAPLRLLGGFDNLILGYADRTAHLAAEHVRLVNAGGGLVKPVVVDDGRVVGTWTPPDRVDPFPGEQFDPSDELADVRRFLGMKPAS